MKRNKIAFLIISLIVFIFIIFFGPMDIFTHGYYSEEVDIVKLVADDLWGEISLAEDYEVQFTPQHNHMVGVEIYLKNHPVGNTGNLILTILNNEEKIIDKIDLDLSKVMEDSWYKVYTSAKLKEGQLYKLNISATNCPIIPCLQMVNPEYLPTEELKGNVLISFAYGKSTFTAQNKALICLFIISVWLFLIYKLLEVKRGKLVKLVSMILFITSVLAWNYMYNSMDNQNTSFSGFQLDSESLVTDVIYAEKMGKYYTDISGFGLGKYYDLNGRLNVQGASYLTDDNWLNGYSRTINAIIVNSNVYSKKVAVVGNQIEFSNGDVEKIVEIFDDDSNIIIHLKGEDVSYEKNGALNEASFLDENGEQLHKNLISAYNSQYGLQGKFFRYLAHYMGVTSLKLSCSVMTAFVFAIIVILISTKYNNILGGCFLVTFWLSPWIVNFARNLYWVEFTWFIPMVIGLFCSWKILDRKCRIVSYILAFIAILCKSLCGYEYITAVMMGLIAFLLVDFIRAVVEKNRALAFLTLRTIIIIGTVALLGFLAAICIHAQLRGNGNLIEGIKTIYERDVLRRTAGADLNNFNPVYWDSFNASIWQVYCQYFHFSTEVITGITGNLFSILCIVPLCILGIEARKKLNVELLAMYVVFFLLSISWFILAKSHSYIHTTMNYVLWYFGFIQICFYIIVNKVVSVFNNVEKKEG